MSSTNTCTVTTVKLESLKIYNDVKELKIKELNRILRENGVNIKSLSVESKRLKLCSILKIPIQGNDASSDIVSIINNAKSGWTKDIRQIPSVTIEKVKKYLILSEQGDIEQTEDACLHEKFTDTLMLRYKTSRSYDLWASGNIHSFEYNSLKEQSSVCLLRCKSNASWTTGKVYETSVVLDKMSGDPVGAYCLCVGGAAAACSHTAGMLFGVSEFISHGFQELPDGPATTEKLAYWINPRGSSSKPKPFHDFVIHKKKFNKAPRKKKIRAFEHDPRHPNDTKVHFQDYLQLFSSLRECKPNAPINKLYQPSKFRPPEDSFFYKEHSVQSLPDMYIVTEFSDPMVPSREEIATEMDNLPEQPSLPGTALHFSKNTDSLKNLTELVKRTPEEIRAIEESTKGQAKNILWHDYRKGIITASNAHNVKTAMVSLKAGKSPNVSSLLKTLLGKSFKGNKATEYGNKFEPVALRKFEEDMKKCHVNTKVRESGLYLHCVGYIGASPDGVLCCDCCGKSLIEIKCPFTLAASNPKHDFDKTLFLKRVGEKITLNRNHKYYTQVQVQMGVTNIQKTHFIVWSPVDYIHEVIEFDQMHWNSVFENISLFFEKFLGPYLIKMNACPNESESAAVSDLYVKCGQCLRSLGEEKDTSILCECNCGCRKWYHWSCVYYDPTEYEDLDCLWYCPTCVRNCDIIF